MYQRCHLHDTGKCHDTGQCHETADYDQRSTQREHPCTRGGLWAGCSADTKQIPLLFFKLQIISFIEKKNKNKLERNGKGKGNRKRRNEN